MPSSSAPTRHAPIDLWRIAERFLHTLYNLFGAPEDVARGHTLTRAAYALLLKWIVAGEALTRKLLLIEAAAYPRALRERRVAIRRARERRRVAFTPDNPGDWRVSFQCFPTSARTRGQAAVWRPAPVAAIRGVRRFHSAWPIAERYEALIRVFNDPAPYARRLARRLYAEPRRARAVLRYPIGAASLVGAVGFDTVCCAAAEARARAFPDTS